MDTPTQAAIASAYPLATDAGFEILAAGGNAFDAAVTVSATLAVVEPYSAGLGGGGLWLLHRAKDGQELMLDGRERAPLAAHRDMYIGADGRFVPEMSLNGPLSAGIPGEPAALAHLANGFGRLPLARSLESAIRLARVGFAVDEHYRRLADGRLAVLEQSPAAARQFLQDGEVPPAGALIVQPDLADELEHLARGGWEGTPTPSPNSWWPACVPRLASGRAMTWRPTGWWSARPSSVVTGAGEWSVPRRRPPAACCSTTRWTISRLSLVYPMPTGSSAARPMPLPRGSGCLPA